MNIFLHIIIIIIISIFYINIYEQNKRVDEINVYENEFVSNNELQLICKKDTIITEVSDIYVNPFTDPSLNVNLINSQDNSIIPIPLDSLNITLDQDKTSKYYTNNNNITASPEFSVHVKPKHCFFSNVELCGGSQNYETSCITHNYYRKFLYINNGNVTVYVKPLNDAPIKPDYVNYTFNVDCDDKDKFTSFDVVAGHLIYIPPNCIYKIKYNQSSVIHDYSYHSICSVLSNIHHNLLYFVQQSNTVNISALKKI